MTTKERERVIEEVRAMLSSAFLHNYPTDTYFDRSVTSGGCETCGYGGTEAMTMEDISKVLDYLKTHPVDREITM